MYRVSGRAISGMMLTGLVFVCQIHAGPSPVLGQTPEWSFRKVVSIGSVDDPIYGLSAVRDVVTDADHVYVLLAEEGVVRVFTRAGEFVRDLGGRGEGPGEFLTPSSIGWHGSRLWVVDVGLRRFTLFDVATGEAKTIRYAVDAPLAFYVSSFVPRALLANGTLVGEPTFSSMRFSSMTGAMRADASHYPVLVSDTTGSLRDTLVVLSLTGGPGEIRAGLARPSARVFLLHPLPDDDLIAYAPDGAGAVVVRRGSWEGSGSAEFDVARIGALGDTLFRRRIGYEARPVPAGFFAEAISQTLDAPSVVDRRAHARAVREFYEQRRYFPPVTTARVASDGTTWLAGPDEKGEREWLVLDASGTSIGTVRLPTTARISEANQTEMWVVEKDALDIPYVVRYEILP